MVLQCLPLPLPQALPLLQHPQQGNRAAAAGMLLNTSSQKASANRISAGEATLEQLINLCDFRRSRVDHLIVLLLVAACIIFA